MAKIRHAAGFRGTRRAGKAPTDAYAPIRALRRRRRCHISGKMIRRLLSARPARPAVLATALLLSACAGGGGGDFPSLARRPVEGVLVGVQTEPTAPMAVPAGATLQEKLTACPMLRRALPPPVARLRGRTAGLPRIRRWHGWMCCAARCRASGPMSTRFMSTVSWRATRKVPMRWPRCTRGWR
jgi:hypothetical protein